MRVDVMPGTDEHANLREHLAAGHGRDPLDLQRMDGCLDALHRFEHVEAAAGLIRLRRRHRHR